MLYIAYVTRLGRCAVHMHAHAGRVQSVALRLVCEREAELESFVPQQSWTVEAELALSQQAGLGPSAPAVAAVSAQPAKRSRAKAAAAAPEPAAAAGSNSTGSSVGSFRAALTHVDGKRYVPASVTEAAQAQALAQRVQSARLQASSAAGCMHICTYAFASSALYMCPVVAAS